MKDDQDKFIHIGDIVTFNEQVRPRRLVGTKGVVKGLGDIRVHVEYKNVYDKSIVDVRVDPDMLRVGDHVIYNPIYKDPEYQKIIAETFMAMLAGPLARAVRLGVIDQAQREALESIILNKEEDAF